MSKKLKYIATLQQILEDALDDIDVDEEGFEYTIGKIMGGELKLVFEPDSGCFDSICTDGVDGFGLCAVIEVDDND